MGAIERRFPCNLINTARENFAQDVVQTLGVQRNVISVLKGAGLLNRYWPENYCIPFRFSLEYRVARSLRRICQDLQIRSNGRHQTHIQSVCDERVADGHFEYSRDSAERAEI